MNNRLIQMIQVSVQVEAPLSKVWTYWNDPAHITQWNAAADSWHCPIANNDLREGGKFSYRMEAKDGSIGFDLSGKYIRVEEGQLIESIFDDGRRVLQHFRNLIMDISESANLSTRMVKTLKNLNAKAGNQF